jgi:hypothetical protein
MGKRPAHKRCGSLEAHARAAIQVSHELRVAHAFYGNAPVTLAHAMWSMRRTMLEYEFTFVIMASAPLCHCVAEPVVV